MTIKKGIYIVMDKILFPNAYRHNNNQILILVGQHPQRVNSIRYKYLSNHGYGLRNKRFIEAIHKKEVIYIKKNALLYAKLFLNQKS